MTKNWKLIVLVLACMMLAAFSVYSQGTRTTQIANQMGPYVISYADSGTFLLNSQTGQTWMLVLQDTAGAKYFVFSEVMRGSGAAGPRQ